MRVLIIHDFYQHFGGEDRAVQADMALMQSAGIDVELYSRHNNELKSFGLAQKALFPLQTIHSKQTMREIASVATKFKPDVAYLHNLYPLISPSVYDALGKLAIPAVQALHDFRPFCSNGWCRTEGEACERCVTGAHWNAVVHKCVRDSRITSGIYAATMWRLKYTDAFSRVAAFLCPSEFARSRAQAAGIPSDKLFVRPHFVDVKSIQPRHSQGEYALYMGRLSAEKGVRTLVEAFRLITGVPLVIAGTGPLETELREYVDKEGMENVRFAGFCSGEEKNALLDQASFVIVPSEVWETFGIVILEAYAAGKPVIGSDVGAIPYLVRDGATGLLFPNGSATALADRVDFLARNPSVVQRMGLAARDLAEEEYGAAPALDRLMAILTKAAGTSVTVPVLA